MTSLNKLIEQAAEKYAYKVFGFYSEHNKISVLDFIEGANYMKKHLNKLKKENKLLKAQIEELENRINYLENP